MYTRRMLRAAAICGLLALGLSLDVAPADPTLRTPAATAAAPSTSRPYEDWVGSEQEARSLLAALPGGASVPIVFDELGTAEIAGAQQKTAALVYWSIPNAIFVSQEWVDSLHGPEGRDYLSSVLLHEYAHVLAMTSLSQGGSLPEELLLSEADRSWAGGAMAGLTPGDQSASLEAIASCVQVAAHRANTPLMSLPETVSLPRWLVGSKGAYLTDPRGCPLDYTTAAFDYLQEVGDVDLRPQPRLFH